MSFLKKKLTRVIAFLLAVICAVITALNFCSLLESYRDIQKGKTDYISNYKYDNDFNVMFSKLWLTGTMYLKNLNSKGEISGSDNFKKSLKEAMYEREITDAKGEFIFKDLPFDYCVSYYDNILTNVETDDVNRYFRENEYAVIYENKGYSKKGKSVDVWYFVDNSKFYATDYGVYYYDTGLETAAVFGFDTTRENYIRDINDIKIYYNSEWEYLPNAYGYDIYSSENEENISQRGDISPLRICISPTEQMIAENKAAITEFSAKKERFADKLIFAIPAAVLMEVFTLFVFFMAGFDENKNKYVMSKTDIIVTEIPITVTVFSILGLILLLNPHVSEQLKIWMKDYGMTSIPFEVYFSGAVSVAYAVILEMISSIIRRIRCRQFFRTSFFGKIFISVSRRYFYSEMFKNDILARRFILKTVAFVSAEIFSAFIFLFFENIYVLIFFSVAIFAVYIFFNLRDFADIMRLGEHISAISSGDYTRREVDMSSVVYGMTDKLNNISNGIQTAVENRIRSERMKIDLVTNVSHDLKTPLTSIVSYVDLLSAEELSDTARDYVKILEQKTDRLRSIVSDVFDLAKATSGTDIEEEQIDAVILAGQVLADMSDKTEKYGREIKTKISAEKAPVLADGKKMYRVLQNILDNALKYSLENTRIYFKLFIENQSIIISVKNIASYEMNFTPEEITERFIRGDKSRTSEGSGLGLAIAKSFTEACGGNFEVSVDGDVFAVIIKMKLSI